MSPKRTNTKFTGKIFLLENIRLLSLIAIFAFLFLFIELRLFAIQVIDHDKYQTAAQDQHWNTEEIAPKRGSILTSDGYVLAGIEFNYLLYGEPNRITGKYKVANDLAKILVELRPIKDKTSDETFSLYHTRILDLISKDLMWVSLEKGLSPIEKEKIESLNIIGLGFEKEPGRYYPEKSLGAHVLGFVASDDRGEKCGYFGIEGKFNEDLRGKPGKIIQEIDAKGNPILAGGYKKLEPIEGRDIYLTINRAIQYMIEKKLKEGVEKYDAVSGNIIVMDPATADIYALANYPTYSPDDFSADEGTEEKSPHRKKLERQDLAISQTYEPGSVIKPLTISAAIDLKIVTPETTYQDNGPVVYSDYNINNWDGKHHGTMNIIQLLQKSNNIGAAWVGHKVGSQNLYKYLSNFGIGVRSGIELEGEDTGILRDKNTWTDIDLANISFGQGMSATPLQVVNAFNTIANGGYLLEPRIISKISDGKKDSEIPVRIIRKVISKETSDTMVDLLEKAASGGEAQYFILKNYRIAGKTGTAQIPVNGTYDPLKTNATFVGFVAGSKKFSMIVRLEEPRTSVYAAETAVPLWMEIAQELVKFFNLPPDGQTTSATSTTQPKNSN